MEALIARGIQVLIALGGAYVLTLWFAVVVWTFQDIQARSRSVVAQIFSTLVVMIFSIPGLLVYLILRPRYTLDDAFQRSLEEEYLMQDLEELPLCPGCQQYVEDDWVYCPACRTELRDNCPACDRLIDLRWEICPYCGTEQYPEDEEMLPQHPAQPVITASPQYMGRPQLSRAQAGQLAGSEQATRPVVPATVRVDFQSGNVDTEKVPEFTQISRLGATGRIEQPRRVPLGGNGYSDLPEWRETAPASLDDERARASAADGASADVASENGRYADAESGPDSLPTPRKSKKRGGRRRKGAGKKASSDS